MANLLHMNIYCLCVGEMNLRGTHSSSMRLRVLSYILHSISRTLYNRDICKTATSDRVHTPVHTTNYFHKFAPILLIPRDDFQLPRRPLAYPRRSRPVKLISKSIQWRISLTVFTIVSLLNFKIDFFLSEINFLSCFFMNFIRQWR